MLTESRTYLPPSDGPVKDCGVAWLAVELHSLVHCALSLNPRALQWSFAAVSWSPLKTKGASAASLREPLSWDRVLSASVSLPESRGGVEDLTESLPGLGLIVNSSSSLQFPT